MPSIPIPPSPSLVRLQDARFAVEQGNQLLASLLEYRSQRFNSGELTAVSSENARAFDEQIDELATELHSAIRLLGLVEATVCSDS